MNLLRLFNTEVGHEFLKKETGVSQDFLDLLPLLGISGIANVLGSIKLAKYFEFTKDDVIGTVATDSAEMYGSRVVEMEEAEPYTPDLAARDYWSYLASTTTDHMEEFTYYTRKRVHHLKYYTWVEQQGRTMEELNAQWYDDHYWVDTRNQVHEIDRLIEEFNERTGVLAAMD